MAQLSFFLKLEGVTGSATQKGYEGSIPIDSFSWSESAAFNPVTAEGSLPEVKPLSLVAPVGRDGPTLLTTAFERQSIASATLTVLSVAATGQPTRIATIKLADMHVTSYQFAASTATDRLLEQFELTARRISLTRHIGGQTYTGEIDLSALG